MLILVSHCLWLMMLFIANLVIFVVCDFLVSFILFFMCYVMLLMWFLQRVSIACYAKRCTSYHKSVCLTVRLTVCLTVCHSRYHAKTTQARIMGSSM